MSLDVIMSVIMSPIGTVPSSRGTKDLHAHLSCPELLCVMVPCRVGTVGQLACLAGWGEWIARWLCPGWGCQDQKDLALEF